MSSVQTVDEIFAGRIMLVRDRQGGYAWEQRNYADIHANLKLLDQGKQHYWVTPVPYCTGRGARRPRRCPTISQQRGNAQSERIGS